MAQTPTTNHPDEVDRLMRDSAVASTPFPPGEEWREGGASPSPLEYVRGEIEALRSMIDKGYLPFTKERVGECLAHILREIERQAVRA